MMIYTIHRLIKHYNGRTVLNIDSLSIEKGCRYALVGPNGAGKTTLLNILGFLDHPSAGDIRFLGRDVRFSESALQPLRRHVVMINQHPILFTATVYKNIEFGLKVRKIPQKIRKKMINEALDMVSMKSFIYAPAERLSGGETQRVAIARALALAPDVMLCDEPFSSIDLENQAAIIHILKQVNEQKNITVIFTTHDRMQASSIAHRTIFLDKGKPVSSSYENIYSGIAENSSGSTLCRIHDNVELSIIPVREGNVRLLIDPEKIKLLETNEKSHSQNCLVGRVVQAADESDNVRLVVDSGIYFNIIISREDYKTYSPKIGEDSAFYIPPESIQLI